jgi:hypothetical protein
LRLEGFVQDAGMIDQVKKKLLTQVSVGHYPSKIEVATDDEKGGDYLDVIETELIECSLTPRPLDGGADIDFIAASFGYEWSDEGGAPKTPAEDRMDKKLLIQMLNMAGAKLADDANDAQVTMALQSVVQGAALGSKASEVLTAIGLDQSATGDVIRAKIADIRQPANFVPKAKYDELEAKVRVQSIDTILAQHKDKIPEGQKEFAKTLLAQGVDAETPGRKMFDTWVATLPTIRTQNITGRAAAVPNAQNDDAREEEMVVTAEDEAWCQTLGYFRDERDKATGKVTMKAVDRMVQMAEMTSSEALSLLFGQPVPETALDRSLREQARIQSQDEA